MANLELSEATVLAEQVAHELFERRRSPIPGAVFKVELAERADAQGSTFDVKALGFKGFAEFVANCANLELERRPGSDFVVLPRGATAATRDSAKRLRRDLWFAFVSFPVSGTRRAYDPTSDRIIYESASNPLDGKIPIEPIAEEQQLEWRKDFAARLPHAESNELLQVFNAQNPLRAFSIIVRRNITWAKAWNRYQFERVLTAVQVWAEKNGVSKEKLFYVPASRVPQDDVDTRRALYALLDRVPVEELLNLTVSLRWLVESKKSGD